MPEPYRNFTSKLIPLPAENVDTDQIIPARFLKTTEKSGLADALFNDWRYDKGGNERPDFVLNKPENRGATVLVAGNNFGCGSSREHAPWALLDFGIRAVVSTEIADIFRSNSLKNGLLPVIVDAETHRWLLANPGADVRVDLTATINNNVDHRIAIRLLKERLAQIPNVLATPAPDVDLLQFLLEGGDVVRLPERGEFLNRVRTRDLVVHRLLWCRRDARPQATRSRGGPAGAPPARRPAR